jgi:hypothetical protein
MSDKTNPVTLVEDQTGDKFLLYTGNNGIEVDLRFEAEQPWFTETQLAEIFGVGGRIVNYHIHQFLISGELRAATTQKIRVVRVEGGREVNRGVTHYSLDVAFYVGYRVNSDAGILFRQWATGILVTYATKGFVIDSERLKNPDGKPDYFDELLAKIRDIRSSEKRMWTRIWNSLRFATITGHQTTPNTKRFFPLSKTLCTGQ